MEVTESPTRVDQRCHRSIEPVAEIERRRCEYYLCLVLDALEATVTPP